ncbi:MAG: hypothetical protein A2W61_03095 [Deltaproteobacteria bacterium RIFCSPLOWO2_01_44_7]|nr:MAG: hypothetical protein A2712_02575 [Deltaproteobacteria bacterium RIFCSPHIGHO2_01_FULL_43_49]OGQ38340.1 MAG: hypothetical protein A2W61_03095 [Deltaproteobacteria bacterium RIFCSPLOWO2_01_44_7]OGQ41699.1 MAG: hypothetical protein A3I70_08260 [Deltaproteobacteria bacterium RIFCSPLOWO2_02_FULL_44_34]
MNMNDQREIFKTEGDNYFCRNKETLEKAQNNDVVEYLKWSGLKVGRILDVGCCFGHVLHLIKSTFPDTELFGFDPSWEAIGYGKKMYPDLHLRQGFAHDLSHYEDGSFDLVVISFVLSWIDRALLLKTVAEIDRVLKNNGHLIIRDFAPSGPCKVEYHHLPGQGVYTFKHNYWQIFSSTQLYTIIYEHEFLHAPGDELKNENVCKFVVLQKRPELNYSINKKEL